MRLDLSTERVRLIDEALKTQIRLLESYINKDADQMIRLEKFRQVQYEIETALLSE